MSDELADGKIHRTTEINKELLIKFAIAAGTVLVLLGLLFLVYFFSLFHATIVIKESPCLFFFS